MSTQNNSTQASGGIGCFTVLGLIFITLKLTHNIDWPWKWVLAPFWGPVALVLVVGGVAFTIYAVREFRKR